MKISRLIVPAATAVLLAGGFAAPTHAEPTAEHCDSALYPNKVELDGASNTEEGTGLTPGTQVCVKAGTGTTLVTVASDGSITQTTLVNKKGKPLGISYYASGEQCQYNCGGGPS